MGVITNLIRTGMEKKARDQENQVRAFEMASKSEDPQLRQWGIQSLVDFGQKTVQNPEQKKHLPVLGQIATLMGNLGSAMNPVPKQPKLPHGAAPAFSEDRATQDRQKRAQEETQLALQRDKLLKQQEADIALTRTKAIEMAKLDIDDLVEAKRHDLAKRRLEGIKNLLPPDQYTHILAQIETGVSLPAAGAQKTTTVELKDGSVVPAWESTKPGQFETLDHKPIDPSTIRNIGVPVEPKLTGEIKTRVDAHRIMSDPKATPEERQAAKETLDSLKAKAQGVTIRNVLAGEQAGTIPAPEIKPNTKEYHIAQDIAYGKLTMGQFRGLYSYSRDANKRAAIYDKARELNPDFNAAEFEAGFRLASNPRVRQQLASMDNVQEGVPDLLKFSEEAQRSGIKAVNKVLIKGGIQLGDKRYSNLHTAAIAFADELSGALGYGSATDMSREMGFNMTDPNLSPEAFASGVQEVLVPFLERKRGTLLKQMGPTGKSNPSAPGGVGIGADPNNPLGLNLPTKK